MKTNSKIKLKKNPTSERRIYFTLNPNPMDELRTLAESTGRTNNRAARDLCLSALGKQNFVIPALTEQALKDASLALRFLATQIYQNFDTEDAKIQELSEALEHIEKLFIDSVYKPEPEED